MKELSYFQMRAYLYPNEVEESVEFKLNELETLWHCNKKNVKQKIKKYEEEGRFIYIPGRGRGNSSRIHFKNSLHQDVHNTVITYINNGQLEHVFQLLELNIPKTSFEIVFKEIQKRFGLDSSQISDDVLRTIVIRSIKTLDPINATFDFESYLIKQLGSTLVTYDQKTDSVQPHIAHHWKVDIEYKTWTFHLRKGVLFHHQKALTSDDVLYTFERFQKTSSYSSWLIKDIEEIECLSPYIVQIKLNQPNPYFIRYLSTTYLSILSRDEGFQENKWIGTGPFQLKERTNSKIVLKAFDHYFLERPILDEIEFYLVPRKTKHVMDIKLKNKETADSVLQKKLTVGYDFLAFNFQKPSIVHHPSFRAALFHLFDIKKMWNDLGRNQMVEASSYFPWNSNPQQRNRSLVIGLIKDSGYQGEPLTLFYKNAVDEKERADWLRREAASVGIKIRNQGRFIEEILYSSELDQKPDLILCGEVASLDYHISFIDSFYNKANIIHRFLGKENIKFIGKYLDKMRVEQNYKKREYWINKIETYIRKNHLLLFQIHPIRKIIMHPKIQNIRYGGFGFDEFQKSWIDEQT
ncbi:ABC transporter substrate-binding protein [Chengkuizengella axinellae]|uniref:ABC transporter substrate-binding protein n=1 Tax=Chengkuizengella axinellae TaxID=3064388 RepID=A0ABT9IX48_9BACL|nr:ABC transporter substrate-binding protein [Chengkuizengella sp. 2205SS18-9]MDP5273922.1 ABC transporter substrate-binding protein [Chengkuizengella sp. 2205SS18-9]